VTKNDIHTVAFVPI